MKKKNSTRKEVWQENKKGKCGKFENDSFMVFSKYIHNFTLFNPILDFNMFSDLFQKIKKFTKSRVGWRGRRGVVFYQNQVMIFTEVWLYIIPVLANTILIHIFKIVNQFLSRIIRILTNANQSSGGWTVAPQPSKKGGGKKRVQR